MVEYLLKKKLYFLGNDADPGILVVITDIYIHPLYDPSSIAYDLAIVETHEEIPFSSKVGQACLPFKYVYSDFLGDTVKVLGEFTLPHCLNTYSIIIYFIRILLKLRKKIF